ncbi:SOS-induced cell division inhibitor SulA [Erwinia psidii]|uniref:Cell division inhibitor SulA n=1 Tax=Erwinia psidii TaxID=69224 RepID=A0A3N6RYD6_9GAMM|nr:SOS-induced cell division inhibitor SulA [Erwinia psidii]MCX8964741.1 cell division inhibitor SulA [Erwinia psidii]RQM38154.1 cell division inhibitor SulA [Erwinia psidii]
MQTHFIQSQLINNSFRAAPSCSAQPSTNATGLISELIYSENQLDMTQLLLVPLLQQRGAESRWQLWLTPRQRLSRTWLIQSGLPLDKVMQVQSSGTINTVEAMITALQTGNYSVVLGWLPSDVSVRDRRRLQKAASHGQALGLIMRPDTENFAQSRPLNGLKIQSGLYH